MLIRMASVAILVEYEEQVSRVQRVSSVGVTDKVPLVVLCTRRCWFAAVVQSF